MIHRLRVLPLLLRSPPHLLASHTSPVFSALRFLSSPASTTFPKPFAVEDYLIATCGLTQAQALKASKKLSHLKSPSNPDSVLAFLAGLGLPRSDIAAIVAKDPPLLCASVERTLAPRAKELSELRLSGAQIARIVPFARCVHHSVAPSLRGRVDFWLAVFGSFDKLVQALRMNCNILRVDIEGMAKLNLAFLQQCGVTAREIAGMNIYSSRLLTLDPKSLQEAVERVEELGVERGSRMFRYALVLVAFMSKEDIATKIRLLQKLGFSQDQALVILRRAPLILGLSEDRLRRVTDFLMRDVGLEAQDIVKSPALIMYSLERRLLPRYCVLKVLRVKGLQDFKLTSHTASMSEKTFVQRFVHPFKDHVPSLADLYASKCSGRVGLLDKKS